MYKYTICFIKQDNKLLLINREYPAWMGSRNGVGGKLEANETPLECIIREVFEETGMKLNEVKYKGTVTWEFDGVFIGGMYAFIAEVPNNLIYETPKKTCEGILDWKNISWVLDPQNTGVAKNLPIFLPKMLNDNCLYEHRCFFKGKVLQGIESIILQEDKIV
jgi:8-oxo-dGTP diphosphatase